MIKPPPAAPRRPSPSSSLSAVPLSFSLARAFAGRKARYAEIVRSERRPPNERERPPPRGFPPILSRTPLPLTATALFLLRTTSSSSSSSSFYLLLLLLYHHHHHHRLFLLLRRRRRFSTRRSRSREFDARRKQHGHGYGGPTIHSGGRVLQSYRTQSRRERCR